MLHPLRRSLLVAASAVLPLFPTPLWALEQDAAVARTQEPAATAEQEVKAPERPEFAFLWKIEKIGVKTPSYLFGTMHVPDKRFIKFNDTVKKVFKEADAVYTELPMDDLASMTEQIQEISMLKNGEKLNDYLDQETQEGLNVLFGDFGFSLDFLQHFRPFMIGLTLEQFRLKTKYADGKPLDEQIFNAAKKSGKEIGGVETLPEQMAALSVLSDEEYGRSMLKAVRLQLKDREQERDRLGEMADLYLGGDEKALWAYAMEDFDPKDPLEVRSLEALLTKRNVVMAKRLGAMIQKAPEKGHVFVFGALHFLGPDSVNRYLEKAGFKVTRLTPPPPRPKKAAAGLTPVGAGR